MSDRTQPLRPAEPLTLEPEVRPTPRGALALPSLPTGLHFRRSHFPVPAAAGSFAVGGAVATPLSLTVDELREQWASSTVDVVLECAGHRRNELAPATPGVAWGLGAVSEAAWTGTPLGDVLAAAQPSAAATAVAFHGRDRGGEDALASFGRAVSLAKALHPDTILAWAMNGGPIPAVHGGPVRAIVPGHYAVDSVKWLERVEVLERAFDGPFQVDDYRLYEPGAPPEGVELHELPVHALLVHPGEGEHISAGGVVLRGIAWGGRDGVDRVDVSVDGGPWRRAELERTTRWARTHWHLDWTARRGAHVVAVRATDAAGGRQPDEPRWNELGYGNNSVHHVTLDVA